MTWEGLIDPQSEHKSGLFVDENGTLRVSLWVWDPGTLQPVRMTQPVIEIGDLTVSMSDVEALLADNYFKDNRFDYDGDNLLIYMGKNTTHKASESSATWFIWKLAWSSGNLTRKEGPLVGAWSNRASLSWGT